MTSGRFTLVPVAYITVDRGARQRKNLEGIEELAASIKARGLINPITITSEHELVAGERRLSAVKLLGWDRVAAQFVEDLSRTELKLIELEENTKRHGISWQEQCRSIWEIHSIYMELEPDWNPGRTADAIGMSRQHINDSLRVHSLIEKNDEQIVNANNLHAAKTIVARKTRRAEAAAIEEIYSGGTSTEIPLVNADLFEWLKTYEGPRFNFIHCDFPYGTNFDKQAGMHSANRERYEDSFTLYSQLLREALPLIPTTDQVHLMFWFSMNHFEFTKLTLKEQGWKIDPFPMIWARSDNAGIVPDHNRGGRRTYETAFLCYRGDRPVVRPVALHYAGPREDSDHPSTKPREMLRHFFRMFVDDTTVMMDPTCGSGNAVRVAKDLGAKSVLGVEVNSMFYADAVRKWEEV